MASTTTQTTKYNTQAQDISLSFKPNPLTGDLISRSDMDAIKDSVRNIVLTNKGDRPFQPDFGCNVQKLLFQNLTPTVV